MPQNWDANEDSIDSINPSQNYCNARIMIVSVNIIIIPQNWGTDDDDIDRYYIIPTTTLFSQFMHQNLNVWTILSNCNCEPAILVKSAYQTNRPHWHNIFMKRNYLYEKISTSFLITICDFGEITEKLKIAKCYVYCTRQTNEKVKREVSNRYGGNNINWESK